MKLTAKKIGDAVVVEFPDDRLEAGVAEEFKKKMIAFIDKGNKRIAIDISSVAFMDSTGLGVLVSGLKRIGREGDLVLVGVKEPVMKLLQLTRMDRVFKTFPDARSAIEALSG